jgi:hypothetical protein
MRTFEIDDLVVLANKDIVTIEQAAKKVGLSYQYLVCKRNRYEGFPLPAGTICKHYKTRDYITNVYSLSEIKAWLNNNKHVIKERKRDLLELVDDANKPEKKRHYDLYPPAEDNSAGTTVSAWGCY